MSIKYLAQVLRLPTPPDTGSSAAPFEIHGPLDPSINDIGSLISVVLKFLIPFAALILLFVFIWGGYDFMMSQGDPAKVKSGRAKITAGIIGFVLLAASFFIVAVIAQIFGYGKGLFYK